MFCALVGVAVSAAAPHDAAYEAFLSLHGKLRPAGRAEYELRAATLRDNVENVIPALNAAADSFGTGVEFAVNQFGDLTNAEWRDAVLMPKREAVAHKTPLVNRARHAASQGQTAAKAAPAHFDWRDHGAVTPVKDQGTVGSCWAFSTVGNLEGQHFLTSNVSTEFSEEFLVDCDSNNCGVFGGWPYLSYQFIMSAGGIPTEAAQPYCSGTGHCYPCMANPNRTFCGPPPSYCNKTWDDSKCPSTAWESGVQVQDWHAIDKDESEMAATLTAVGPLSVLLDATFLQFYRHGVWAPRHGLTSCKSDGTDLDHAVLLVGYGSDAGTDYWTVKNSWSAKWGEAGYFRIKRGVGQCGINTEVTTSVVRPKA